MKREVSLNKDKRGAINAKNLIALYRSLGWTDKQIKDEMLRIKAEQDATRGVTHERKD